jgi:hypothetical protein
MFNFIKVVILFCEGAIPTQFPMAAKHIRGTLTSSVKHLESRWKDNIFILSLKLEVSSLNAKHLASRKTLRFRLLACLLFGVTSIPYDFGTGNSNSRDELLWSRVQEKSFGNHLSWKNRFLRVEDGSFLKLNSYRLIEFPSSLISCCPSSSFLLIWFRAFCYPFWCQCNILLTYFLTPTVYL